MKKITIFLIFLFVTTFSISQNLKEIEKQNEALVSQKESLLNKKKEIDKKISEIEKEIELNNSKIIIQNLKKNAIKVSIKRNCSFYEKPSDLLPVIDYPKYKKDIYLIEHYKYGNYFKAIYNDKIGYIKEKDIKSSKLTNTLKKKKPYSKLINLSSTTNKSKNTTTKKRNSYSKTYYRGPRGGCYYINSNGNKSYVSRNLCN